jgi:hypothetical protein
MKRWHLNLLLLVLALALVPALYFSREKPAPPPKPMTGLSREALTRVLIHHDGADDIRLEKQAGAWWLVKPVHTLADPVEINGVLELATHESGNRYPVAGMKLAEFGLDKPSWYVELNGLRISFGDLDPIQGRRYLRIGDEVDLVDDPPSAALDANYSDLVSKRLLPPDAKPSRIELGGFSLARNPKTGGWAVSPASADRGADAAQKLANAWAGAQSMWNAMAGTATGKAVKEAKPADSVHIVTDRGEFRFIVVERKDQLVLARPDIGVEFTLPKNLVQGLFELQAPPAKPAASK